MPKLRLGVIGAGSWTVASHLPNLARRAEVIPAAVCRVGLSQLEIVRRDWGFAIASEHYQDVIAAEPDIVVIASPSSFHFEHASAALRAGAHVMVEKPFTLRSADAWRLVELAAQVDRHIVVAFGYNHRPVVQAAARLLAEHGVGHIESLLVTMCSGTRDLLLQRGAYPKAAAGMGPDPQTWTDPELSGGGYGQAQLSHALAVALYLSGLRADEVFALTYTPPDARVELDAALTIRYEGGAIGAVNGASAHRGYLDERDQLHVRVVGDQGQLDVDFDRDTVTLFRPDTGTHTADLEAGDGGYDCDGPPDLLVDLALGRERPNPTPGELGARTVEILEAAYRSAASGRPIRTDALAEVHR